MLTAWPAPVHRQGAYADTPLPQHPLLLADAWAPEALSLPIGPTISSNKVRTVIDAMQDACSALVGV